MNNITFAELAVLHKALLHNSPVLFGQITEYVNMLERMSNQSEEGEEGAIDLVMTDLVSSVQTTREEPQAVSLFYLYVDS